MDRGAWRATVHGAEKSQRSTHLEQLPWEGDSFKPEIKRFQFGASQEESPLCAYKESACSAGDWVQFLGWEDPLEKEMDTPVFLPGESHGQRSLEGYNPWGSQRVEHD